MNQVALNLDFNFFFFQGKGGELDKEISWWALMSSLFVGLGAAKSIGGNDVLNKSSAVCLSTGTGGGGGNCGEGLSFSSSSQSFRFKKRLEKITSAQRRKIMASCVVSSRAELLASSVETLTSTKATNTRPPRRTVR